MGALRMLRTMALAGRGLDPGQESPGSGPWPPHLTVAGTLPGGSRPRHTWGRPGSAGVATGRRVSLGRGCGRWVPHGLLCASRSRGGGWPSWASCPVPLDSAQCNRPRGSAGKPGFPDSLDACGANEPQTPSVSLGLHAEFSAPQGTSPAKAGAP